MACSQTKYRHTYIYIRRPLLARGHQAAKRIVSYTIYIYIYMLHLHPLILYDIVSCCMLYSVCCIHPTVCSSVPWESTFYHLLTGCSGVWVSLMRRWNSLNSKQSPIPPKIIKMAPWDLQKTAKWCPKWSLKPSKSWKHWKCGILWKPFYLLYFWEVGTSENLSFSIQKSSKNMPAMQIILFTLQISEHIKKCLKIDSNWKPIIHPSKIVTNLPWDPRVTPWVHPRPPWSQKC